MRKLIISAALFVFLVLLGITIAGCDSTALNPFPPTPTPTPTPTPSSNPNSQPATVPMGAFIEDTGSQRNVYVATNDGSGFTRVNAQSGAYYSVYVLPDGSKGVFAALAADGYSQIYYLSPVSSTGQPVQLTTTPVHKQSPMLSADGSKIVFLQLSDVQNLAFQTWDVALMDADGMNQHLIPNSSSWYPSHPSISPDGTRIALEMAEGDEYGDMWAIFIMNADGSNLTRLTGGYFVCPVFSPDGKQLVFSSVTWGDKGIFRINTDGSGLTRIGENIDEGDPLSVGDRIMFVRQDQIYSMKSDGSDVKRITNNNYKDKFEFRID